MATNLPLCPCNSGQLYELCCFKKIDDNNKPLFYQGAMAQTADGKWHPLPNVRMLATICVTSIDPSREFAEKIISPLNLTDVQKSELINPLSIFCESYKNIIEEIKKEKGRGISFQTDSLKLRSNWQSYLFNGRMLLDKIGQYFPKILDLKIEIDGLNKKKLTRLLSFLENTSQQNKRLNEIKKILKQLEIEIIDFIALRDKEKIEGKSTIVHFPVNFEGKIERDGIVNYGGKNIQMIAFIEKSYNDFIKLIEKLASIEKIHP